VLVTSVRSLTLAAANYGEKIEAQSHRGGAMPLIRVELFDYRMNAETSAALIEKLTDALCEATHPGLRDHTWVIVEGHNPKNWGLGGKPWPVDQMPPAN
jgi:phenylpyruvate tautomerase PptA (4-oxalocrotonate tautomerase family)